MLELFLKTGTLIMLLAITYQDLKDQKVVAWLFLCAGILISTLYFTEVDTTQYLIAVLLNVSILLLIVLILALYSKLILQKPFFDTIGLGDILFFLIIALGFSTVTFLILFSTSILFTGATYFIFKKQLKTTKIPLAGFQALFVAMIFASNWLFNISNLYLL